MDLHGADLQSIVILLCQFAERGVKNRQATCLLNNGLAYASIQFKEEGKPFDLALYTENFNQAALNEEDLDDSLTLFFNICVNKWRSELGLILQELIDQVSLY